jgi:hypothetical protein
MGEMLVAARMDVPVRIPRLVNATLGLTVGCRVPAYQQLYQFACAAARKDAQYQRNEGSHATRAPLMLHAAVGVESGPHRQFNFLDGELKWPRGTC